MSLDKNKKYLIVSIMRQYGTTGVQSHCNSLMHGLTALGINTNFLNSFSCYKYLYYPIYAVRPLFFKRKLKNLGVWWYRFWHYLFLYYSLKQYLKHNKIDLINAQCPLSALAAMNVKRRLGLNCKIVLTCHFNVSQAEEFECKGEIQRGQAIYSNIKLLEKSALKNVDAVVFVSEFSKKQIAKFHQINIKNSFVINNGVECKNFSSRSLRAELDIPNSAFVLISVGTLEPRKNQTFLLDVLQLLIKKEKLYYLILVGDGQDRIKIEKLAEDKKIKQNVKVLGFRDDARQLLAISNLYCHPALIENFPVAIVEALAEGLPVIAAPVGGVPELIKQGENGFLIQASSTNVVDYVNQIESLYKDSGLYSSLSLRAKKYFQINLNEELMCNKYADVYQRVLGKKG